MFFNITQLTNAAYEISVAELTITAFACHSVANITLSFFEKAWVE
jgi:hypothetical protein